LQLPGQVDGIPGPRVHALTTDRTVDVSRISTQEHATAAEVFTHAVMDAIGREPIDRLDLHLQMFDRAIARILEAQILRFARARIAHSADQSRPSFSGQGEHAEEVGFVEVDVQLTVERGSSCLNIGYIEQLPVGSTGKPRAKGLANQRARPVTTGEVGRLADFLVAITAPQLRDDAIGFLVVPEQLCTALD
jgi:hypothetical protein